jgi:hypothetical protein
MVYIRLATSLRSCVRWFFDVVKSFPVTGREPVALIRKANLRPVPGVNQSRGTPDRLRLSRHHGLLLVSRVSIL